MTNTKAKIITDSDEITVPKNPAHMYRIKHPNEARFNTQVNPNLHHQELLLTRGIYIMEEWWQSQNVCVQYPIFKNTSYCLTSIPELETYVRTFHTTVMPKQSIAHKHVVFGVGATQVLHAAMYALSVKHSEHTKLRDIRHLTPLYFTHQKPGYLDSKFLIESFNEFNIRWIEIENIQQIEMANLVEIITSPNNPNTQILQGVTDARYRIHDRVNLWPFLTTESETESLANDEISIFSLAKVFSFSGSRVGYAFVNDPEIAEYMRYFVIRQTHGVCSDGQIRCLTALKYLLDNKKTNTYMNWLTTQFKTRWEVAIAAFAKTELQLLNRNGPNLWLKTPGNAQEYLKKKYNIQATYGPEYGTSNDYARLNMQCSHGEFNELIWRLEHIK